jgi:hypothetical protein
MPIHPGSLIMMTESSHITVADGSSSDECGSQNSCSSRSDPAIKTTFQGEQVSAIKRADEEEAEELSCSV